MVRSVSFLRLTMLSCVGLLAAACGGSDVLDAPDASVADARALDGTLPRDARDSGDAPMDVSIRESGFEAAANDADAGLRDAEAGSRDGEAGPRDGSLADGDAALRDVALPDSADAARLDGGPNDARLDSAFADVTVVGVDVDAALLDDGGHDAEAGAGDAEAGPIDADAARDAEASAPLPNLLGSARTYAVVAGQTITITPGPPFTTIVGDMAVYPGNAIATLPLGQPTGGVVHLGDPTALQAQTDLTVAYNNLAGRACGSNRSNVNLGGLTLAPNVYCFDDAAMLTGALVLDAGGDPNAVWVFQIGTGLTTGTGASVSVIGGGSACNVYWQIGSSAVIETGTAMMGNIVALTSISLISSSTLLVGRALARNGSVTMDGNAVSAAACQ